MLKKVKIDLVRVGDLIRNQSHPSAGVGIVVEIDDDREASQYVIAVWPEHGDQIAYADEIEVVSESR